MAVRPILSYFDLRGRAEAARLLLTDGGVAFDDRRIVSVEQWRELRRVVPFGGLPRFEDGRVDVTQSQAILRYLARRHGLVGEDPVGWVVCDEIQEVLSEFQEHLWRFAWQDGWRNDRGDYAETLLKPVLGALQRWYHRHGGGEFWVGSAISHVDYLAWCYLDELRAFFPDTLSEFAALTDFHARMCGRPRIAAYLESDRRPLVFGMAIDGPKVDPDVPLEPGQTFLNPWTEPIVLADV